LLKHDCRIESSISQAGRLFLKAKFYRKIIREIFRLSRNILKLSCAFYIKKKLDIN
ncbi:lipooligosaccharide biosynthesis glycosyltransferase, partial [Campylobacter jejuni]|nr:lipooligosaccharide biosynthesis glycosyltransferase [Campylobacter jejuni]